MTFHPITSFLVATVTLVVCLAIISFVWIKIYHVVRNHQAQIQDQMAVASQSFNMARFRNSAINTMLVLFIVLLCYTLFPVANVRLAANLNRSNVVFLELCHSFVFLNSSLNPFVCCWRQRDLCAQAKHFVMKFRCCQTGLQ